MDTWPASGIAAASGSDADVDVSANSDVDERWDMGSENVSADGTGAGIGNESVADAAASPDAESENGGDIAAPIADNMAQPIDVNLADIAAPIADNMAQPIDVNLADIAAPIANNLPQPVLPESDSESDSGQDMNLELVDYLPDGELAVDVLDEARAGLVESGHFGTEQPKSGQNNKIVMITYPCWALNEPGHSRFLTDAPDSLTDDESLVKVDKVKVLAYIKAGLTELQSVVPYRRRIDVDRLEMVCFAEKALTRGEVQGLGFVSATQDMTLSEYQCAAKTTAAHCHVLVQQDNKLKPLKQAHLWQKYFWKRNMKVWEYFAMGLKTLFL